MQGHDENSKEKIREERRERHVFLIWFLLPLLHVNSPFPKPTAKNILNNNIQIWLIKEKY